MRFLLHCRYQEYQNSKYCSAGIGLKIFQVVKAKISATTTCTDNIVSSAWNQRSLWIVKLGRLSIPVRRVFYHCIVSWFLYCSSWIQTVQVDTFLGFSARKWYSYFILLEKLRVSVWIPFKSDNAGSPIVSLELRLTLCPEMHLSSFWPTLIFWLIFLFSFKSAQNCATVSLPSQRRLIIIFQIPLERFCSLLIALPPSSALVFICFVIVLSLFVECIGDDMELLFITVIGEWFRLLVLIWKIQMRNPIFILGQVVSVQVELYLSSLVSNICAFFPLYPCISILHPRRLWTKLLKSPTESETPTTLRAAAPVSWNRDVLISITLFQFWSKVRGSNVSDTGIHKTNSHLRELRA